MTNLDPENKTLISPATTPGSIQNGQFPSTNYHLPKVKKKDKWYKKIRLPIASIFFSILQITFFLSRDSYGRRWRFEPSNQREFWRFLSYMLVHDSWQHLALNVGLQCLFGMFLENQQRVWKVCAVYLGGGVGGALGASCVTPDLLVGASAGVYALLGSYVSYFVLNFSSIRHKYWICSSFLLIVISDICYNVLHYNVVRFPTISWGAHLFGALTGILMGLVLYGSSYANKTIHRCVFCTALIVLAVVFATLILVDLQIRKCNAKFTKRPHKYLYFC